MRITGPCLFALAVLLQAAPAAAAERAAVIRAGELKAKPFVDADTAASLAANQSVNVLSRQGGWVQVETNGKSGWVRMLNLRMATSAGAAKPAPRRAGASPASLFTGSSGKTVTTGIKGMDEEDIRNATPNMAEVAVLASLAVPPAEASANAQKNGLKEHKVEYLKEGGRK
jgi:uncharacterized protein YgiM (DUF1202 family)